MKKIFVLFLLSLSFLTHAGQGGNGGDAVVCPNGVATLLDYSEADFYGRSIKLDGSNYREKVFSTIKRLNRASKNLEQLLVLYTNEILNDLDLYYLMHGQSLAAINQESKNIIFTLNDLVDIPDSNHSSIPSGCQVKQLMIQKAPDNQFQKRYVIDVKILNQLDSTNIAGLVLHEAIYRIGFEISKHQDSLQSRGLNIFLGSSTSQDPRDVTNALIDFNLFSNKRCEIDMLVGGFYLSTDQIEYLPDGRIRGVLCEDSSQLVSSFNYEFKFKNGTFVQIKNTRIIKGILIPTEFQYKNGSIVIENNISYVEHLNDHFTLSGSDLYIRGTNFLKNISKLEFKDANITYNNIYGDGILKLKNPLGYPIERQNSYGMKLNEDLTLKSVSIFYPNLAFFQNYEVAANHFDIYNDGGMTIKTNFSGYNPVKLRLSSGKFVKFKTRKNRYLYLTFDKNFALIDVKQLEADNWSF